MKRLYCEKEFKYYTFLRQILLDLDLADKDYLWLISDIEAHPREREYQELLDSNNYLLLNTKELLDMLETDDFQWIWAVFSAIPAHYQKEDILKFNKSGYKNRGRQQEKVWAVLQKPEMERKSTGGVSHG